MAQTFTVASLPAHLTFTMGNSNVATLVNVPAIGRLKLTLVFVTNAGKFSTASGLTDGGAIGANYVPCNADTPNEIVLGSSPAIGIAAPTTFFVASATGSTVCHAMIEDGS